MEKINGTPCCAIKCITVSIGAHALGKDVACNADDRAGPWCASCIHESYTWFFAWEDDPENPLSLDESFSEISKTFGIAKQSRAH